MNTILTITGRTFDYNNPEGFNYSIEDIAHPLSNICRFGGHCRSFYSVAQHSVIIANLLPKELQMEGLFHDASEAFTVDIPKPLKVLLGDYNLLEKRILKAILNHFGIFHELSPEIKRVENIVYEVEVRDLMNTTIPVTPKFSEFETIDPLPPKEAKELFLATFYRIRDEK